MADPPDKSYKFYYFPLTIRAEPIRMLLNHAGAEWRNYMISFDQWPALKPEMPGNQMPVLELKDGTRMGESQAIMRYLGSVHGYYPDDPRVAYEIDYLIEGQDALLTVIYKPMFAKTNEEKEEQIKKIFDEALPKLLNVVEPLCEKANANGDWLCTPNLSIADFWIGNIYTNFINEKTLTYAMDKWPTCLDNFPHFRAYGERFSDEMKVWLEYRKPVANVNSVHGYEINDVDGKPLGTIGEHAAGKKAILFVNVASY